MNHRFCLLILLSLCIPFLLNAQNQQFVGVEKCRTCHQEPFRIWASSKHAFTQKILGSDQKSELRCLFCHATDAQRNLANYSHENVQCEACHGPGTTHLALVMRARTKNEEDQGFRKVDEKVCTGCHAEIRSSALRAFDFDKAMKSIRHW